MGRTIAGSISELKKQIEFCKKYKKEIYGYAKNLEFLYLKKKISLEKYRERANEKLKGRTIQEWFDYYDEYIQQAEIIISKKKKEQKKTIFTLVIAGIILFSFIFLFSYSKIQTTGFLIQDQSNVGGPNVSQEENLSNQTLDSEIVEEILENETGPSQEEPPLPENITLENLTETNLTGSVIQENITLENLTGSVIQENITLVNISTLQYKAVINRNQKWIKIIEAGSIEDIANLTIELPKGAENISVKTGAEIQEALLEIEQYEDLIETEDKKGWITGRITGNVVYDIEGSQSFFTRFFKFLRSLTITGNVIQEEELKEEIVETPEGKIVNIGNIADQTQEKKIAVEYYTAGPTAVEENIDKGKRVIVSSADEEDYTDILAFTNIPEKFNVKQKEKIKIYWQEEKKFINFTALDLNTNGKLDYVEWIVPHWLTRSCNIQYSCIII